MGYLNTDRLPRLKMASFASIEVLISIHKPLPEFMKNKIKLKGQLFLFGVKLA